MTQTIKLYNTLTKQKETFTPLKEGKVTLYSCGPTVYDYAHIGNFRSFLFSDLLTRVLKSADFSVEKVMNITDVGHLTNDDLADASGEDKIGKKAKASGKTAQEVADFYAAKFIEDEAVLRIEAPDHRPKATEYIAEQIAMTKDLIARGFAYAVNGSVYFRVAKFKAYGQLSGNTLENLDAGSRVEVNNDKENPYDFALWKKAESKHLMQWPSPWGQGFPGWHIECSAMSRAIFGDQFDIHTGGEDNIFPHHECEIAQNACSCSEENQDKTLVKYWLHAKHLLVDGTKMSKSKGNFYTIRDLLEKGWKGEEIRYLLLSAHYRTALNFTMDGLEQARNTLQGLRGAIEEFKTLAFANKSGEKSDFSQVFRKEFKDALFDDLNVSKAIAATFEMIKSARKKQEQGFLTPEDASSVLGFLIHDFAEVFDCIPEEKSFLTETDRKNIEDKIRLRQEYKANKNWEESDKIRGELLAQYKINIEDLVCDGSSAVRYSNTDGTVFKTLFL